MVSGTLAVETFASLGFTHVIWVPDSALGPWEADLETASATKLLRVCREGEAWALAAGLHVGGSSPLVVMQSTGFFESGDALRNVLFDLQLPLSALIGYRSFLVQDSPDSAKRFLEPVLQAWGLDYVLVTSEDDWPQAAAHWGACQQAEKPGVVLLAEGKM